jgi:hypothetical protein
MPKSRKRSLSKRNKHCDDPATENGLKQWYQAMFEKFGWIILAQSKGYMKDKVQSYKEGLFRLQDKLECKIEDMQDPDKKKDLEIMHKNLQVLIAHVKRDHL